MPKTLLLADDSVTIQKVVGISFANEDVVLLTVDNGDDAVARAREASPDLVLADVMMPGKDGYEVCEILKGDPELRHVPVLLLSGTFEPFDEERARRAGADGHITKPFEAQALVDQVNALLARAEATPPEMPAAGDVTRSAGTGSPAEAFDFFDEEMAQTAPSPLGAPTPGLLDGASEELAPLELEAAVEDDEPVRPAPSASTGGFSGDEGSFGRSGAGDTQATVLFDEPPPARTRRSPAPPPFLGDGFEAESLATPAVPAPSLPALPEADAPAGYEESFDFGFEDGGTRTATVAIPAAPPAPMPTAPPVPVAATRLFEEDDLDEPVEAISEPVDAPPPLPPASFPPPPPAPTTLAPPPVPTPAPPPVAIPGSESGPLAVRVSGPTALSEPIQKQLQETLEKIVWEAFGDLTERIVRDVLERVEAVAWEVIPQMAETLIREEIRQLKDGEEA
ncbi:MAG: response regulator [Deltaproteobacteria bacterium]|nr:response regulator [Deltaproteobacteria bacterium]